MILCLCLSLCLSLCLYLCLSSSLISKYSLFPNPLGCCSAEKLRISRQTKNILKSSKEMKYHSEIITVAYDDSIIKMIKLSYIDVCLLFQQTKISPYSLNMDLARDLAIFTQKKWQDLGSCPKSCHFTLRNMARSRSCQSFTH